MTNQIKIELIDGEAGQCIGINDYRVAGPKPVHGVVVTEWKTTREEVLRAFLTPDQKHKWLSNGLCVVPERRYGQLVAALRRLLKTGFSGLSVDDYQEWVREVSEAALREAGELEGES